MWRRFDTTRGYSPDFAIKETYTKSGTTAGATSGSSFSFSFVSTYTPGTPDITYAQYGDSSSYRTGALTGSNFSQGFTETAYSITSTQGFSLASYGYTSYRTASSYGSGVTVGFTTASSLVSTYSYTSARQTSTYGTAGATTGSGVSTIGTSYRTYTTTTGAGVTTTSSSTSDLGDSNGANGTIAAGGTVRTNVSDWSIFGSTRGETWTTTGTITTALNTKTASTASQPTTLYSYDTSAGSIASYTASTSKMTLLAGGAETFQTTATITTSNTNVLRAGNAMTWIPRGQATIPAIYDDSIFALDPNPDSIGNSVLGFTQTHTDLSMTVITYRTSDSYVTTGKVWGETVVSGPTFEDQWFSDNSTVSVGTETGAYRTLDFLMPTTDVAVGLFTVEGYGPNATSYTSSQGNITAYHTNQHISTVTTSTGVLTTTSYTTSPTGWALTGVAYPTTFTLEISIQNPSIVMVSVPASEAASKTVVHSSWDYPSSRTTAARPTRQDTTAIVLQKQTHGFNGIVVGASRYNDIDGTPDGHPLYQCLNIATHDDLAHTIATDQPWRTTVGSDKFTYEWENSTLVGFTRQASTGAETSKISLTFSNPYDSSIHTYGTTQYESVIPANGNDGLGFHGVLLQGPMQATVVANNTTRASTYGFPWQAATSESVGFNLASTNTGATGDRYVAAAAVPYMTTADTVNHATNGRPETHAGYGFAAQFA